MTNKSTSSIKTHVEREWLAVVGTTLIIVVVMLLISLAARGTNAYSEVVEARNTVQPFVSTEVANIKGIFDDRVVQFDSIGNKKVYIVDPAR
ncbi:MAG: hypothetical protein Q8P07_02890 [bacterium]|nr:hypothetical protein [bacterium]